MQCSVDFFSPQPFEKGDGYTCPRKIGMDSLELFLLHTWAVKALTRNGAGISCAQKSDSTRD